MLPRPAPLPETVHLNLSNEAVIPKDMWFTKKCDLQFIFKYGKYFLCLCVWVLVHDFRHNGSAIVFKSSITSHFMLIIARDQAQIAPT